jgi:hypothetical protein
MIIAAARSHQAGFSCFDDEAALTDLRHIAVVRDYDALIAAFRERADEIMLTRVQLDEAMKTLPDGYAAKLLAPVPVKGLGRISLGPMLQALGLKIVLAEDLEALERVKKNVSQRAKLTDTGRNLLATKKRRRYKFPKGEDHAKLMRARQVLGQTPAKRSWIARRAARTRWRAVRAARRAAAATRRAQAVAAQ